MSIEDPTPEFWILLREIEAGRAPEKAVAWFDSAFDTVDAINATITSMRANGMPAPTEGQARALANYYRAACNWLGRKPSEEECRSELQLQKEASSTKKRLNAAVKASPQIRKVKHFPKL